MSRTRYYLFFYAFVLFLTIALTYLDRIDGWVAAVPALFVTIAAVFIEKVQRNNETSNIIAESIVHLICVQETNGKTFFNQRWKEYAGQIPDTDEIWESIVHAEDLVKVRESYYKSLSTSEPFSFEYRIRRHDGQYRWHLVRGIPVMLARGKVDRWVSTSTDIHDQKVAETEKENILKTLEERTTMLSAVLEQMPFGIVIAGNDRKVLLKNQKIIDAFSLDDTYRVGSLNGFREDGTKLTAEEWPLLIALRTGKEHREDIHIPDQTGKERLFRFMAAPVFSKASELVGAVVIADDISEYKRLDAERATRIANEKAAGEIKRSQQMLEALVENIPSMIFIKDAEDLRYLKINRAGEELLGYTEAEVIGKTPDDLFPPEQAAKFIQSDRETINANVMIDNPRHEIVVRNKGVRTLHTKKFVLTAGDGRRLLVGISHDITNLIAGEKQMIVAREQAEQVARIKSEFLANMSHEIRTPLNGVIGMTELVLEGQLDEQQKRYMGIIQDSGKALLAIVNDVLDFSKVEAGQIAIEAIEFDIRKFFESQLGLLQMRAQSKELNLSYHFDEKLPVSFKGDPHRISQVLNNLIGNAIKFTETGKIEIRAELLEKTSAHDLVKFSVSDSGIGISKIEQARLFKPFVQGDGSMARKYGGTGLGLTICKQLVELMGGEVAIESEINQGSTFWFTVKLKHSFVALKEVPAKESLPINPLAPTPENPIHILIAEDNLNNQILAEALVKRLGYVPHLVVNGAEALKAVQKFDYALVLMDCQMPELDGYEATRQIREIEKTSQKRVPIVALTANARPEDREKCLAAGMDDFISKPIRRANLEDIMKAWANAS